MRISAEWVNRAEWLRHMQSFTSPSRLAHLERGVGRAAIRAQQLMRENLESMIYSQPPAASGYIRTRTLFRSTHAAAPNVEHNNDQDRAFAGEDLAATRPEDVVLRQGTEIMSDVGSWIRYASYVHEGANQPSPRPFVEAARDGAEQAMTEEVEAAVQEMMVAG